MSSERYSFNKDNGIEIGLLMIRCKTHHVSHTSLKWS